MLDVAAAPTLRFRDPALGPIWEKVRAGERLDFADGLDCLRTRDLLGLGRIADWSSRRTSGDRVYYTLNVHVNPTNICVLSCKFCDFAAKKADADAYEHSVGEILDQIHPDVHEVTSSAATTPTSRSSGTRTCSEPSGVSVRAFRSRRSPPPRSTTSTNAGSSTIARSSSG